jgi:hypothetical protein
MKEITNYFLQMPEAEEVKVWSQMFFDDGSVTPGKYISRAVFEDQKFIDRLVIDFLKSTGRLEGVIFIWGAGRVYAKKANLSLFKGRQTLRLRNL